jgi:hypothetical protein
MPLSSGLEDAASSAPFWRDGNRLRQNAALRNEQHLLKNHD